MNECAALQQLNESSDYISDWVDWKTPPDYVYKCLTEGYLPPGGQKEKFRSKSIYIKNSHQLIGFHRDHQHYGYAQEFVNYIIGEAAKLGFSESRIGVHLKNWPALRFWTQLGFDKILGIGGDKEHSEKTFSTIIFTRKLG